MTISLYLKDLDMGQDLTFETLFTKKFEKTIDAKSKEHRSNERTSDIGMQVSF